MPTEADNVAVAVTGGFYYAPLGTTLPADATTALAVGFDEVGYLGEDGTTQTIAETTTDLKAWQNSDIVRTIQTEHKVTYKLTLLETNEKTVALYFGNYAAGVVQVRGGVAAHHVFVLDVIDGGDHIRIVIPDGMIAERGDVVYKNGEAIAYPITINCFPDSAGVKSYVHYDTAGVPAV